MLRFTTTSLAALAISALPLAAMAESTATDQKSEAVVVAAVEDAEPTPAPIVRSETRKSEKPKRLVPHGSSQSEAGYRFTNPYAVPQQTLPLTFPALTTFSF